MNFVVKFLNINDRQEERNSCLLEDAESYVVRKKEKIQAVVF